MNGTQLRYSESMSSAITEIEQLVQRGESLHDRAVFDFLVGIKNGLKTVLTKRTDSSVGVYRLKQN